LTIVSFMFTQDAKTALMIAEDNGFHEIATLIRHPFRPPPPGKPSASSISMSTSNNIFLGTIAIGSKPSTNSTALSTTSDNSGKKYMAISIAYYYLLQLNRHRHPSSLQHSLSEGSKPWYKSKVVLAREGRAVKTALSQHGLVGKSFVDAESSVGLTQLTGGVSPDAASSEEQWVEHVGSGEEHEAAVARMMKEVESLRAAESESKSVPSTSTYKSVSDVTYQSTSMSPDATRSNRSSVGFLCGWISRLLCGGSSNENASASYKEDIKSPPDQA